MLDQPPDEIISEIAADLPHAYLKELFGFLPTACICPAENESQENLLQLKGIAASKPILSQNNCIK